jgi:hypothetical protein
MPPSFEEELQRLLARASASHMSFEEQERLVHELHRKHSRKILPPIIGTISAVDDEDAFGGH